MKTKRIYNLTNRHTGRVRGFVLLVTLIVLMVLATLTTSLSMHLSMSKRRQQYMIDYQQARYGVDSGMKFMLNYINRLNFKLINRQDMPDFSDLFVMDQAEFGDFIADWSETVTDEQLDSILREGASLTKPVPLDSDQMLSRLLSIFGGGNETADPNTDALDPFDTDEQLYLVELDPNDVVVPGPYGPPWPLVTEPIEMDLGSSKVTITIEDENAKMPLSWLVTRSKEANKRAENALQTFCEWMAWDNQQLVELQTEIKKATNAIYAKKRYQLNAKPISVKSTRTRTVRSSRTSRTRRTSRSRNVKQTKTKTRPAIAHSTDFAKLFHSTLLDREFLARPLPDTGERVESPLKYLSLWGAQRVNINTAPRHVLEATFALAIDSFDLPDYTQQVILARQEKPIGRIEELKELLGLDQKTMDGLKNYITTTSNFFKVRVTSSSGAASSTAVATIVKDGNKSQRLAILYEL